MGKNDGGDPAPMSAPQLLLRDAVAAASSPDKLGVRTVPSTH